MLQSMPLLKFEPLTSTTYALGEMMLRARIDLVLLTFTDGNLLLIYVSDMVNDCFALLDKQHSMRIYFPNCWCSK